MCAHLTIRSRDTGQRGARLARLGDSQGSRPAEARQQAGQLRLRDAVLDIAALSRADKHRHGSAGIPELRANDLDEPSCRAARQGERAEARVAAEQLRHVRSGVGEQQALAHKRLRTFRKGQVNFEDEGTQQSSSQQKWRELLNSTHKMRRCTERNGQRRTKPDCMQGTTPQTADLRSDQHSTVQSCSSGRGAHDLQRVAARDVAGQAVDRHRQRIEEDAASDGDAVASCAAAECRGALLLGTAGNARHCWRRA